MAWCVLYICLVSAVQMIFLCQVLDLFHVILLLFIWQTNDSVDLPLTYLPKSPIEAVIPGMTFTLIFTIGLVYLVLSIRVLRSS